MSDPQHPTNDDWVMFDAIDENSPNYRAPPHGAQLLLLNEGGTLVLGHYTLGIQAWAFKPKVPPSVKARQTAKLKSYMERNRA